MARLDRRQAIFAVLAATLTGATTVGTAQPMMGPGSGRGLGMMGGGPGMRGGLPNRRSSSSNQATMLAVYWGPVTQADWISPSVGPRPPTPRPRT